MGGGVSISAVHLSEGRCHGDEEEGEGEDSADEDMSGEHLHYSPEACLREMRSLA